MLMDKIKKDGQKAIAITDHGNMFGVFNFVTEASKRQIKAIVGCEFYLVPDRHKQTFSKIKNEKDERYHQLLLAKNQSGYQNLSKLCSLGYLEGLYGKYPRIDKELIQKYHEGLIATSCCIGAEIPQLILAGKLQEAEEALKWWINIFGEDFYIELQRHGLENIDNTGLSQEDVNKILVGFAKKYDLKIIATNDVHYVEREDAEPHDILLCVNTGSKKIETDRFKFPNDQFYLKTQAEMQTLFADLPQALDNTLDIYSKVESPKLKRDIILPNFPIPKEFKNQDDYLLALVMEGAKQLYPSMDASVTERIQFEMKVITEMKFSGYFLIVQDFIKAARTLGVRVGPGRGSAAGSVVAYCLGITALDPIKYNLLFERFLNPQRISMPDMDIDFDDEGRQKVIDYVVNKYGKEQVAQIVTFSTMAAKSSIRDVGRVLDYPLPDTDRIAKLVPNRPKVHLEDLLDKPEDVLKSEYNSDEMVQIQALRSIHEGKDYNASQVLDLAKKLEGSVRNTGIHAAGIIIAPEPIDKIIPVCTSKETELLVTQFDGSLVESAGMLKMDFLGLRTLSIINEALILIKESSGQDLVIEDIPLDDALTFELFQKGEMVGIFQFESDGMQKYLRDLKPENVEDLIAMNALYRPGPMDNIPLFIRRKMGQEKVEYPHEFLSELLKPTYGILVYQEQIMQTAQIMAGYTLASADMLRRAMGKKKHEEMQEHRKIFVEGAKARNVNENTAEEIFELMARFADYGFNRSHAAAYSIVAFQTAYLKAHYPAEFMAAVLTHNKNDISKLEFYLQDVKRMGIEVLPPDVNESELNFSVKEGKIRFGLSALKGVGEGPVEDILTERKTNGPFRHIFDITSRLNLRAMNKKSLEALVLGGALDSLAPEVDRAQYFAPSEKYETFIEHALRLGSQWQELKSRNEMSLFSVEADVDMPEPVYPKAAPWSLIERLNKEKDITGIFISAHPLDEYRHILDHYTTCNLTNIGNFINEPIKIAGMITKADHRISKKGTGYGNFTIEDFGGKYEFTLFSENYLDHKNRLEINQLVYIRGTQQTYRDREGISFKIQSVQQLATAGNSVSSSLLLKVPLQSIDESTIRKIKTLLESQKGNSPVKVVLLDAVSQNYLYLMSDEYKVEVTNKLLKEMKGLGFEYSLN